MGPAVRTAGKAEGGELLLMFDPSAGEATGLVVEGETEPLVDPAVLEEVIAAYETKGDAVVFAGAPATAYGFGRDHGVHTHPRWAF